MEAPAALALALLFLAPLAAPAAAEDEAWQIVAYGGPISVEEQAFLRSVADLVLDFAPPFGYYARVSPQAHAALEARGASVHEIPLAAKASADLAPGMDRVRVLAFPDADAAAFAAHLLRDGARSASLAHAGDLLVDVELGRIPLAHLAAHKEARWVEPLRDVGELDNSRASSIVQSGTNDAWPLHDRGVNGSSQIVAYCDSGLDTDATQTLAGGLTATLPAGRAVHEMFADPLVAFAQNVPSPLHRKVALYYAPVESSGLRGDLDDVMGHGTHVGGTLAGDAGARGARDGSDGVAFAARLAVCDVSKGASFQVLANYSAYWQPAYDAGARVHSNSWGTSPSSEYTLVARQHDAYAWVHRDLLIFRSMGNAGPLGTMRPEAAAKSVLSIGATTNNATSESVAAFSSRGPASDGRIKPDLVAPGDCVLSADIASPTAYFCSSGTSHSTPAVAGAAALVRDLFAKGFYPSGAASPADAHDPSSALVRAVMIASAVPIASAAPDGVEGWGRPQLARALDGLVLAEDEDAALATSGEWSTTIDIAGGAALRIVLVWTDHPAAVGASSALVNDLDLEVVTPSGAILLGNADLAAPDRANVIERILIDAAEDGEHAIRVRGWNVPMGPQPFAVVVLEE